MSDTAFAELESQVEELPCFRSLSFGKSWTAFWNAKSLRLMWPLVLPCLTNSLVQ